MSSVKDGKSVGSTIYIECLKCKAMTKHTVERAVDWSDYIDGPDITVWATFEIVRCNGCDHLSFRSLHSNSEDLTHNEVGETVPEQTEQLYPERQGRSLADELYLRDDLYDVPDIIQAIYRETVAAVQHSLPTLAGVGIRAVLEATCQQLKAKKRYLADKIDELVSMSLLTPSGAKILHGIRLLGNDAAHEMKAPTMKQIGAALKVIDHLLLGTYVLPQEAAVLPKPKGPRKTKSIAAKRSAASARSGRSAGGAK